MPSAIVRKQQINRSVASNAPIIAAISTTNPRPQSAQVSSIKPAAAGFESPFAATPVPGDPTADDASFDFQHLLEQEEGRTEPKRGKVYGWKVKSKAFFTKPFRRVKKLQHASSVASLRSLTDIKLFSPGSLRSSMNDLPISSPKPVPPRRGSGMTRLLVKSIMVAPLIEPLDSIKEHADNKVASRKQSIHCRIDSCPNIVELPLEDFSDRATSSINASTTSISTGCASSISESDENDEDDDEGTTSATMPSEPETVILKSRIFLNNFLISIFVL